jgi:hypothetical protein
MRTILEFKPRATRCQEISRTVLEPLVALAAIFAVAAWRGVPVGIVMLASACGVGVHRADLARDRDRGRTRDLENRDRPVRYGWRARNISPAALARCVGEPRAVLVSSAINASGIVPLAQQTT